MTPPTPTVKATIKKQFRAEVPVSQIIGELGVPRHAKVTVHTPGSPASHPSNHVVYAPTAVLVLEWETTEEVPGDAP